MTIRVHWTFEVPVEVGDYLMRVRRWTGDRKWHKPEVYRVRDGAALFRRCSRRQFAGPLVTGECPATEQGGEG